MAHAKAAKTAKTAKVAKAARYDATPYVSCPVCRVFADSRVPAGRLMEYKRVFLCAAHREVWDVIDTRESERESAREQRRIDMKNTMIAIPFVVLVVLAVLAVCPSGYSANAQERNELLVASWSDDQQFDRQFDWQFDQQIDPYATAATPPPIYNQEIPAALFDPSVYPDGTTVLVHHSLAGWPIVGYWALPPASIDYYGVLAVLPADYPYYWGVGWVYGGTLTVWC